MRLKQQYLRVLRHTHVLFKPGIYDINSFAITISFIACIISAKYAMVTDGNRETNLVAMVAVKANSVSIYLTVIVYHMISNVEKEKLVIDLYQ